MSEQRPKACSWLLRRGDSSCTSVELFAAELWPEQPGSLTPNRYRVRIDDKWWQPDGVRFYFATLSEVGHLLANITGQAESVAIDAATDMQDVHRGMRVGVPTPGGYESGVVRCAPFERRGRWFVLVVGQPHPVPVDTLQIREQSL